MMTDSKHFIKTNKHIPDSLGLLYALSMIYAAKFTSFISDDN